MCGSLVSRMPKIKFLSDIIDLSYLRCLFGIDLISMYKIPGANFLCVLHSKLQINDY